MAERAQGMNCGGIDEDRRSARRSPSLPNRTGGSPASGFPVGSSRWAGSGFGSEMFGRNLPAAQSFRTRSPSHGRPTASEQTQAKRFSTTPTRSALRHYVGPREMALVWLPALRSYAPWLHGHYPLLRYYGRSDPGRPFRHHLPWFPDLSLSSSKKEERAGERRHFLSVSPLSDSLPARSSRGERGKTPQALCVPNTTGHRPALLWL